MYTHDCILLLSDNKMQYCGVIVIFRYLIARDSVISSAYAVSGALCVEFLQMLSFVFYTGFAFPWSDSGSSWLAVITNATRLVSFAESSGSYDIRLIIMICEPIR